MKNLAIHDKPKFSFLFMKEIYQSSSIRMLLMMMMMMVSVFDPFIQSPKNSEEKKTLPDL